MTRPITSTPAEGDFLFDGWFDPIEAGLRTRVRGFIEALLEGELTAVLSRPRYGRAQEPADAEPSSRVAGHRHGHRTRQLTGSFGPTAVTVPRARLVEPDGTTREWKSAAPRCSGRRSLARDQAAIDRLHAALQSGEAPTSAEAPARNTTAALAEDLRTARLTIETLEVQHRGRFDDLAATERAMAAAVDGVLIVKADRVTQRLSPRPLRTLSARRRQSLTRSCSTTSRSRGDTSVAYSPTFNISGTNNPLAAMHAANVTASRGQQDLLRNIQGSEQ